MTVLPFLITLHLITITMAKYTQSPSHSIKVIDQYNVIYLPIIKLSPEDTRLAVSFLNVSDLSLQYRVLTFGAEEKCKMKLQNTTRNLLTWVKNGAVFLGSDNTTFSHFASDGCSDLSKLASLSSKPTRYTFAKQFVAFCTVSNDTTRIQQFNVAYNNMTLELSFDSKTVIKAILYSEDHNFLYVSGIFSNQKTNKSQNKIIVYETNSGNVSFQINSTHLPERILSDDHSFLYLENETLYKVNKQGKVQQIHSINDNEIQAGFCTKDNLFVSIQFNNVTKTINLLTYSTENGALIQKIPLQFIPVVMKDLKWLQCNDNDLILLGSDGIVRVFHYISTENFPIIAIIGISAGVVALIIIVGLVIYKRKKKSKQKFSLLSDE